VPSNRLAPIFQPLYLTRPERVYIVNSVLQVIQGQSRLDPRWLDRLEALLEDAALWQATALPSLKEATANALFRCRGTRCAAADLDRALRLWAVLAGTRIWRQRVACMLLQACYPDLQVPGDPDLLATLGAWVKMAAAHDLSTLLKFAPLLLVTPWAEVRQAAIDALAAGADDQAVASLLDLAAGAGEAGGRISALKALQYLHPARRSAIKDRDARCQAHDKIRMRVPDS